MELNVAWACLRGGIKCTQQGYGNYFFSDSLIIQQKAGMRNNMAKHADFNQI